MPSATLTQVLLCEGGDILKAGIAPRPSLPTGTPSLVLPSAAEVGSVEVTMRQAWSPWRVAVPEGLGWPTHFGSLNELGLLSDIITEMGSQSGPTSRHLRTAIIQWPLGGRCRPKPLTFPGVHPAGAELVHWGRSPPRPALSKAPACSLARCPATGRQFCHLRPGKTNVAIDFWHGRLDVMICQARFPPSSGCRPFFWSTSIMVQVSIRGLLVAALFSSKHVTARRFMLYRPGVT